MKEVVGAIAIVLFVFNLALGGLFFGAPTIWYLHERYCCWLWPKGQHCD